MAQFHYLQGCFVYRKVALNAILLQQPIRIAGALLTWDLFTTTKFLVSVAISIAMCVWTPPSVCLFNVFDCRVWLSPHSTTPTSSREGSSPTRPTRVISWSYSCGKLNDTPTFSQRSSRGCRCRCRGMRALRAAVPRGAINATRCERGFKRGGILWRLFSHCRQCRCCRPYVHPRDV